MSNEAKPEDIDDLMARLRGCEDAAAGIVFNRYASRLIALARSRLQLAVQQKVDPEDVMQSVFRSFFRRSEAGEFDVANWDNLWTILSLITVRKCANQGKFFTRERRDVRREASPAAGAEASRISWDHLSREPTPDEALVLTETVEQLMEELDDRDRHLVTLALQGFSVREISEQVGFAERTVRRVLQHVRGYLESLRDSASVR